MEVIFQINIFCALLVHGFSLTSTPITGPIFKKLGSASFGKSLGHLHHSLNISDLLFHHHVLRKSLDGPLRQLNSSQFASISNLAKLAQKELELIDDNENEIMLAFNLSPHQRPRRQLNPFMALASTGLSVYTLSLFEQEPEDVNATCKVVPFQDHEILIALGPHEVAVVSKDKICGQMYCPSRVLEEAIPVPSNVIVQIPSSCSLVTSKHQVKGPTSVTTKEHEIVNIEVNLQEWSIFHNFTYSTSVPERIQAIETLKANFTSLSLDHQENGRALWLAFTILSIIVILQTAYLLFECIRVTKQIKKIKTLRLGGSVPIYGRRASA